MDATPVTPYVLKMTSAISACLCEVKLLVSIKPAVYMADAQRALSSNILKQQSLDWMLMMACYTVLAPRYLLLLPLLSLSDSASMHLDHYDDPFPVGGDLPV